MKVQKLGSSNAITPLTHGVEVTETEAPGKAFSAHLDDASHDESAAFVEQKIKEITDLGEQLCDKADIGKLNKYKGLIRDLMNYTVSNGFKFSKSSSFDSRGRGKIYGIVKNVNEKLDQLTRDILDEEKDNIDIVASINDIRGLLVDMLL